MVKACSLLLLAVGAAGWGHKPPKRGPYKTQRKLDLYKTTGDDGSKLHLYYPAGTTGEKFPLISYAHGIFGGGFDLLGYTALFEQLASWGFVVIAPSACNNGCKDGVKSPWASCNPGAVVADNWMGKRWNTWFGEQIRAIAFAKEFQNKSGNEGLDLIDWSVGVAIAGHSMGGQATAKAAHENCTSHWNIKAAATHHGVSAENYNRIGVPLAAFGSTFDPINRQSKGVFLGSETYPKLWRNLVGSSHLEPVLTPHLPMLENPYLATYTAAWFKYNLGLDVDNKFYNMIFNKTDPDYICNSQHMRECDVWAHGPPGSTVDSAPSASLVVV